MEQNIKNKTGLDKTIFWMLKSLLCSYVVTGILLLILAGILYKFNLDEAKVTAGILIIYILSAFAGGVVIGKTACRDFLCGASCTRVIWTISVDSGQRIGTGDNVSCMCRRGNGRRNDFVIDFSDRFREKKLF